MEEICAPWKPVKSQLNSLSWNIGTEKHAPVPPGAFFAGTEGEHSASRVDAPYPPFPRPARAFPDGPQRVMWREIGWGACLCVLVASVFTCKRRRRKAHAIPSAFNSPSPALDDASDTARMDARRTMASLDDEEESVRIAVKALDDMRNQRTDGGLSSIYRWLSG